MSAPDVIDPCFHHLLAMGKKKRRNKKSWQEKIRNELTLIETLSKSKWKTLLSNALSLSISKGEMTQIEGMVYANSSSLRALYDQNQLLIGIVRYGNKHLGWEVALPRAVYLLAREEPLLAEHDFIELNFYRRLEARFGESLKYIEQLSAQERVGQILFSAIARGALF